MFKNNRCCDKSMNYSADSSYNYSNHVMNPMEYPQAMPESAMMMNNMPMMGCQMPPVYECPQERVCHKEFVHEVPHVCPINTRVINHHIYRHTYTPCYTSCEENEICNVYDGCCGQF